MGVQVNRGAVGALVVYHISKHSTFENVVRWLKELRDHGKPTSSSCSSVINPISDTSRLQAVETDKGMDFSEQDNLAFIESERR